MQWRVESRLSLGVLALRHGSFPRFFSRLYILSREASALSGARLRAWFYRSRSISNGMPPNWLLAVILFPLTVAVESRGVGFCESKSMLPPATE
jgi:hypothetical protein